jgi:hypothetical protein
MVPELHLEFLHEIRNILRSISSVLQQRSHGVYLVLFLNSIYVVTKKCKIMSGVIMSLKANFQHNA